MADKTTLENSEREENLSKKIENSYRIFFSIREENLHRKFSIFFFFRKIFFFSPFSSFFLNKNPKKFINLENRKFCKNFLLFQNFLPFKKRKFYFLCCFVLRKKP